MNTDTYIPYGPEWKLEVKKMTKDQIIDNLLLPALTKETQTDLWFPSDLPPKDQSYVLGEDEEGASYVVQFFKGDAFHACFDEDCEHDDHYESGKAECRSITEGYYEMLEQFGNKNGWDFYRKERKIIRWSQIPKSN